MNKLEYKSFEDIFKFLGLECRFEKKFDSRFPFNRNPKDIICSWGQILIPKDGIRETVTHKLYDHNSNEKPLDNLRFMYQIPFTNNKDVGIINVDIVLTFKYDKEYKYGEITKSIEEICFYILENATRTNEWFIISEENIQNFFSYYIIPNQWGIGSICTTHYCPVKLDYIKTEDSNEET